MRHAALPFPFLFLPLASHAEEAKLPHGIRPDVEIGFRYLSEIWWVSAILALALLCWFLYRKWKKKGSAETVVPDEPIHQRIRRELTDIAKMNPTEPLEVKEFYTRLSEASRRILELEGVGKVEQTYDEFLPFFEVSDLYPTFMKDELFTVLHRAELVKFAKHLPESRMYEDDLALSFRMLDRYEEKLRKAEEERKNAMPETSKAGVP